MNQRLLSPRSAPLFASALALNLCLCLAIGAHNIKGVDNCRLATARLSSPTAALDMPVPIPGTNLSVVCFKVQNTSPYDARITAIGLDVPGELRGFALIDPASFNPADPANHVTVESYLNFTLEDQVSHVPGFPGLKLDFALLTGNTFGGGRPKAGLASGQTTTTFCVKGPFPAGLSIEQLLNYSFVRFQRVGPDGESGDVGIWERLLPPCK